MCVHGSISIEWTCSRDRRGNVAIYLAGAKDQSYHEFVLRIRGQDNRLDDKQALECGRLDVQHESGDKQVIGIGRSRHCRDLC